MKNRYEAFLATQRTENKMTQRVMTQEESRLTAVEASLGVVGATMAPAAIASGLVSPMLASIGGGVMVAGVLADQLLNEGKIRSSICNALGGQQPTILDRKLGKMIDTASNALESITETVMDKIKKTETKVPTEPASVS